MSKFRGFLLGFFMTAFKHLGSAVISVALIIIGAIWSDICLYIGLFLLLSNVIVAVVGGIRMQSTMNVLEDVDENFDFDKMFEEQEKNKQLHGEELLSLSDEALFEAVYFQNIDIAEAGEDEENELEQFGGARKTVYILSTFDAEVQNGGLCQFFVNSSKAVAPYLCDALELVGAMEHKNLFESFVAENNIDLLNLESFEADSVREYQRQTKRFDFDSFDDKYYDLPAFQDKIVAYIEDNINEF